jgi:adenylate kinase
MKLIFVGPQGSGKGTQAKIIARKLELEHLSTGDLLRNSDGELKKEANKYINSGKLVPDNIIVAMLSEKINSLGDRGFILDGFPRNINQALELDKITKIDKVVVIEISDEEAVDRIINRVSCSQCGSVFNLKTNPPQAEGFCDFCNSPLMKRSDDNEDALKKRLEIYHSETEEIIKHYSTIKINGEQEIDKVTEDILKYISEK